MAQSFSYAEYVSDERFLADYNAYQQKYAGNARESDKKLMALIAHALDARGPGSAPARLLDIGCSTGNLLRHLRRHFADRLAMTGGDLAESSLAACRADAELAGISFERMDILDLPPGAFDIITVNAVLYMLTDAQHDAALASIARALRPGGVMMAFDFVHPFPQEIEIIERTASHPDGLRLRFRSERNLRGAYRDAGLAEPEILPFVLPIDLPLIDHPADIITHTRKDETGTRMAFRGVLYQPWCHIVAHKAG